IPDSIYNLYRSGSRVRQIAAVQDQVGRGFLQIRQHRLKSSSIAVDVGYDGNSHAGVISISGGRVEGCFQPPDCLGIDILLRGDLDSVRDAVAANGTGIQKSAGWFDARQRQSQVYTRAGSRLDQTELAASPDSDICLADR